MRALTRVAAVGAAGATLYFAGAVNAIVIRQPSALGATAVVVAIAASLAVMVAALVRTTHDERSGAVDAREAQVYRVIWVLVSFMAIFSIATLMRATVTDPPRARDWTPFHNDAIAINECSAALLLRGGDPYRDLDLRECYARLEIGPDRTTPLRRGLLADAGTYPTDDELDAAWAQTSTGQPAEFVWRPSYPALSFVLLVPFVALGVDTNYLYLTCLLIAMTLVIFRAPAGARPFFLTALLGAACLTAFAVGGSADLLYALPLTAAWLWREHRWSALALGVAIATKQIAWFFVPFYLIAAFTHEGTRGTALRAALAAGVFVVANVPFVIADAGAWAAGVLTPVAEPMFARGAGLVLLPAQGVVPLPPAAAFLALEAAAGIAALTLAWRARRSSPELGIVLATLPLFFAWRSLFSYFFLMPLFALAGLARMRFPDVDERVAAASGAVTLLAMPAGRDRP